MSQDRPHGDAARKAWDTRRQRVDRPPIDTSTPEGRILRQAQRAASAAIGRAHKTGLPCDEDWMMDATSRIIEQDFRCAMTGLKFDVDFRTEGAGGTHLAPSPDQIEAGKGYVRNNVRWVLWAVNRAKGEMSEDLFIKICRGVVKRCDGKA